MTENIKNVFELLVKYNSITNKKVIEILENLESSKLTEDLGSYYGSLLGLLNHEIQADIKWIRALGEYISTLDFVPPLLECFPTERHPPEELQWKTLEEYKSVRIEIDNLLVRVINRLNPTQYTTVIKLVDHRGTVEYAPYRILLHLFNHHSHHRGGYQCS